MIEAKPKETEGTNLLDKIRTQRRTNPKYIRDPIHDIIKIEDETILEILDSRPMQRLRYIDQLPFAAMVYPGASHSRFVHSLGVYHLSVRMLDQLGIHDSEYSYDRFVVKLAALLHDVGHGPFSHLFERFLSEIEYAPEKGKKYQNHEWWSSQIIANHEQVAGVLDKISVNLKEDVASIINHTYRVHHLMDIVSSQFDADRLDYMLRDSYMTGVQYGRFDLNWLFRNLSFAAVPRLDEDAAVKSASENEELSTGIVIDGRRGLCALEEFLLGNFYLYKNVYFHKTVQAAEGMLVKTLVRAVDMKQDNAQFDIGCAALDSIARNKEMNIQEYLQLNDRVIISLLQSWSEYSEDAVLKRLSSDLLKRKLFKARDVTDIKGEKHTELVDKLRSVLTEKDLDPKYYLIQSEARRIAYKNLFFFREQDSSAQEIYYMDLDGNPKHFTGIDRNQHNVSSAILDLKLEDQLVIFPDEVKNECDEILEEVR